MNILVINGSPSGENSITLQTMLYIEKLFPGHTYRQIRRIPGKQPAWGRVK